MSFSWTSLFTNQTLTRSNFITNFRTRINEPEADNITDAQIVEFIRQANYNINLYCKLLPEYATASLDGSSSYTLPTNMSELYELIYISADSPANYTLIVPYNLSQLEDNGYQAGTLQYYIRNGQNIEVFGSSVTTGTLRAYGSRIPTFPSTDGAYIDLPDQYLELMYTWCEWKFWTKLRRDEEIILKQTLFFDLVKLISDQVQDQYSRGLTAYG